MISHLDELCSRYEHYRRLGLSVDANDTLQTIQDQLDHVSKDQYVRLSQRYVHVFSHLKPREEAHGCYEEVKDE